MMPIIRKKTITQNICKSCGHLSTEHNVNLWLRFLKAKAIYMEYCSIILHANLYLTSIVMYFIRFLLNIFYTYL